MPPTQVQLDGFRVPAHAEALALHLEQSYRGFGFHGHGEAVHWGEGDSREEFIYLHCNITANYKGNYNNTSQYKTIRFIRLDLEFIRLE